MNFEQLGPYRVGRKLGRGGMGTVFEGTNEATGERAAIKVLSAMLADDPGFRERFESEIETLKKLRHPNIVRLYGWGEYQGHLFYSMELVEGHSLEDQLRTGRQFDWREVTRLSIQMCRALKHAHDSGVIHRDIKPANLMVTADDTLKLSDFGIAKLFGNMGLTSEGGIIGTAEYMAPEQADGRPVTYRCDLYSLGGVMYALLAGRPPFKSKSLPELLQLQRFADPEPVRRYAPETPPELEQIVAELLSKQPEQRPRNAMILGRRLEAMFHGLSARETIVGTGTDLADDDSDFQLADESPANATGPLDSTLAPSSPPSRAPAEQDSTMAGTSQPPSPSAKTAAKGQAATAVTMAHAGAADDFSLAENIESEPAQQTLPSNRFTTVDEAAAAEPVEPDGDGFRSWQTWLLAAGLLATVGLIYYVMQPASADTLFSRITTAAATPDVEQLLTVEPDMSEFLEHYPDDPRAAEVRQLQGELSLHRLERRLERRAKQDAQVGALHPIEQAYFEAAEIARLDPSRGLSKLQAFVDLYSDHVGDQEEDAVNAPARLSAQECVELAQRQVAQLESQLAPYTEAVRKILTEQLAHAGQLAETDPAAATKIYHGIVELYADKPWATDLVSQARAHVPATP